MLFYSLEAPASRYSRTHDYLGDALQEYDGCVCHPDHRGDVSLTQEWRVDFPGSYSETAGPQMAALFCGWSAVGFLLGVRLQRTIS
jgi:hypothetical protein